MHFLAYVLVPAETTCTHSQVSSILERYSESLEVEDYENSCGCSGYQAKIDARRQTEEELSTTFQEIRARYKEYDKVPKWAEWPPLKEFHDLTLEYERKHPLYNQPDENCEDCEGSGVIRSTYNPEAKWDWWSIGGRWNGLLIGNRDELSNIIENNMLPVRDLLTRDIDELIPYAIVTPDRWRDRENKSDEEWRQEAKEILEAHEEYMAVACDLHI